MSEQSVVEIECRDVWKVFGRTPETIVRALRGNTTQSRSQVLSETGHVVAVRGISFRVPRGQTFVVMGLSGSGKSTLVRCISRLTEPTAGEIIIGGRDVLQMDAQQLLDLRRHKVSMVFQNFGLFPHRRVEDNVAYGLEVQGLERGARLAKAKQMIDLVGLAGWERHYPKQLSGGMQQRVGLARALAVDPQILLFDEPFSALDPLIRREMQDELIRLREVMKKTLIFITHDFAEALKLGDQIAIMKDGQFVQVGTPEDLVLNPQTDYVRAFTKDAPRAKVLTAGRIAKPYLNGTTPAPARLFSDSKLDELMAMVTASDQPISIIERADDTLLGYVDRATVLQALLEE